MWWCGSLVAICTCMLGHHHHSCMLGPRHHSRMLVLGPHLFVICCVHFAFVGRSWPCGWSSLVAGVFTSPLFSSMHCVLLYRCLHMSWVVPVGVVGRHHPWWWLWVVVWGSSLLITCAGHVVVPHCRWVMVVLCSCCQVVVIVLCCCCWVMVVMCHCPLESTTTNNKQWSSFVIWLPCH